MTLTKQTSIAVEAPQQTHHNRRILFLSLEFNFAPFSGNGVLCRSLVTGLLQNADHDSITAENEMEIRVICAKPHPSTPNLSSDIIVTHKNLEIWPVQLQKQSSSCNQWKRLDRHGPWKEFAAAVSCKDGTTSTNNNNHDTDINNLRECIQQFDPTDVIAVDWHGMLAWQAFCSTKHPIPKVNVCYYNFRVYSSSSWGNNDTDQEEGDCDENQFYEEMEQLACRLADGIVCLSEHDRRALHKLMMLQEDDKDEGSNDVMNNSTLEQTKIQEIIILPPPLRGDVCKLARMLDDRIQQLMENEGGIASSLSLFSMYLPDKAREALDYVHHHQQQQERHTTIPQQQRLFITCISRLSPEKSPHIFVNLLQQLGGVDFLRRYRLVPILCGARSVDSYADEVIQSFKSISSTNDSDDDSYWPCIVIDHHLGPKELAAIFSHAVLNVHPCLYDAYGMTLVESAAFGVPSVVNCGGKVGAAALLGENEGCIALDLSGMEEEEEVTSETTEKLKEMLLPRIQHMGSPQRSCSTHLTQIAKEARHRALGWDELSCCRGLMAKLNSLNKAD